MDIYIIYHDEPAAGLDGGSWTISDIEIDDDGHREAVREAFVEAFDVVSGGRCQVVFEDEVNYWPTEA